jgi:hypothetical protein
MAMTEACNWLGQKTAIETLETNLIFPKNGLDNGEHLKISSITFFNSILLA